MEAVNINMQFTEPGAQERRLLAALLLALGLAYTTFTVACKGRHSVSLENNGLPEGGKMKKVILFSAAVLLAASGSVFADHHLMGEGEGMKMMDTNKDGMISKDEFMKHHEMMWDKMKKNSAGSVDVKDMEAMHRELAGKHKEMMKDEKKK